MQFMVVNATRRICVGFASAMTWLWLSGSACVASCMHGQMTSVTLQLAEYEQQHWEPVDEGDGTGWDQPEDPAGSSLEGTKWEQPRHKDPTKWVSRKGEWTLRGLRGPSPEPHGWLGEGCKLFVLCSCASKDC